MSTTSQHAKLQDQAIERMHGWPDSVLVRRLGQYGDPSQLGTFQRAVVAEAHRRGL